MRLHRFLSVAPLLAAALGMACSSSSSTNPKDPNDPVNPPPVKRITGQTDFSSAPPNGAVNNGRGGAELGGAGTASPDAPPAANAGAGKDQSAQPQRTVEETDLYRLDGDR